MQNRILKLTNVLGLFLVITVNALANILPINGKNTGEVSAQFSNLFTPAGFTFSIWSIIYLGLLFMVFYQLKGFFQEQKDPGVTKALGSLFLINCIANASWIFAWHYQKLGLSVLIMLILLITLILMDQRLKSLSSSFSNTAFVKFPIGIYLGWICVATIANVSVLLTSLNWSGFGIPQQYFAVVLVFTASVVAIFLINKSASVFPSVAIAWGLFGILNQHFSTLQDNTILISVVGILAYMLVVVFKRKSITF